MLLGFGKAAQNKIRQTHLRFLRRPDPDAVTHKLGRCLRDDVADPVVPAIPASNRHFQLSNRELIFVKDDTYLADRPAIVAANRPHGSAALVHERLRLGQQDGLPGNDDRGGVGTKPGLVFPLDARAGSQCINQRESDIVACPVVLESRIPESHYNTHRHTEKNK